MRRRLRTLAALGSATAALAGCGVQSTGVNVAAPLPISVEVSSASPSVSPSGPTFSVLLFLTTRTGALSPVMRTIGAKPSDVELVRQLAAAQTADERTDGLSSAVPAGLTLQATGNQAREYVVLSPDWLSPTALSQIACTLDVYWIQHPVAGLQASTRLIAEGVQNPKFDDCSSYAPQAAGLAYDKPTAVPAPGLGAKTP